MRCDDPRELKLAGYYQKKSMPPPNSSGAHEPLDWVTSAERFADLIAARCPAVSRVGHQTPHDLAAFEAGICLVEIGEVDDRRFGLQLPLCEEVEYLGHVG